MRFYFLLILTGFIPCAGCQHGSTVVANLYVRYDQAETKLKAEATFQAFPENGEATYLVFQHGVAFINSGMNTLTLPGGVVRYGYEQYGRLPRNIFFRFKDEKGKEQVFDAELTGIDQFSLPDKTLSKSNGGLIKLQGKPLENSEKLVLIFNDANRRPASFEYANVEGISEVVIAPGVLAEMAAGEAQLYLVRVKAQNTQRGNYSIKTITEFYTDSQLVNVTE